MALSNRGDGAERTAYCLNMSRQRLPEATQHTQIICDAYNTGSLMRFMNHSCDPNCELDYIAVDRAAHDLTSPARWELVAILLAVCPIAPTEELTFNYFGWRAGGDPYAAGAVAARREAQRWQGCHCGSPSCFYPRRTLSLSRERHPELPPADYLPNLLQATRDSRSAYAFYPRFVARCDALPVLSEPGFPGLESLRRPPRRPSPFLSTSHIRALLSPLAKLLDCGTPLKPAPPSCPYWIADPSASAADPSSADWEQFLQSPLDTILLLPVNLANVHWLLLVFDLQRGYSSVLDSSPADAQMAFTTGHPPSFATAHPAIQCALTLAGAVALRKGLRPPPWGIQKNPCPSQVPTTKDCGLFTVYNM